jgi:hypothetical protein
VLSLNRFSTLLLVVVTVNGKHLTNFSSISDRQLAALIVVQRMQCDAGRSGKGIRTAS